MHTQIPTRVSLVTLFRLILAVVGLAGTASVRLEAQADNDAFANRQLLVGTNLTVNAWLLNATREPGEPVLEELQAGSVWYRWVAPATGELRLVNQPFDPLGAPALLLFTGSDLANLERQALTASSLGDLYHVTANAEYALAVAPRYPRLLPTDVFAQFGLQFTPPPPNDQFAQRLPLTGDTVEFTAWLAGARLDPGEPTLDPNGELPTIWWTWTAPADGIATLELAGGGIGWAGAYTGTSLANLTRVAAMPHPQTPGTFEVKAGTAYAIAASGYPADPYGYRLSLARWMRADGLADGATLNQPASVGFSLTGIAPGDVVTNLAVYDLGGLGWLLQTNQLTEVHVEPVLAGQYELQGHAECANGRRYAMQPVRFSVRHPNDNFATRPALVGAPVDFDIDLRNTSLDPGETMAGNGSVWWSWTAPATGVVSFTRLGGDEIGVGLFEGTTVAALQVVAGNHVVAGHVYVVRAASWAIAKGRYRLELFDAPLPADAFAARPAITTGDFWTIADIGSATPEPGEPETGAGADKPSLWYSFTPTVNGTLEFGGSPHRQFLVPYLYAPTVFRGDTLATLEPVPSQDSFTLFVLQAGVTYQVRLQDSFPGQSGAIWVHFHFVPAPDNDAFAGRTTLSGDHAVFAVSLEGATVEPAEPVLTGTGFGPVRTRWWSWHPSRAGWTALQAMAADGGPSPAEPVIDVFEGENLATLQPVATAPLQGNAKFFLADPARTYVFRASDMAGEYGFGANVATFHLDLGELEIATPAANAGVRLPAMPTFTVRGTALATPGTKVRYREQVGWSNSGLFTSILIEERGFGTGEDFALMLAPLAPGAHSIYAIAEAPDGSRVFSPPVTFISRPANDDFATAEVITGRHVQAPGTTTGSSVESGEPLIAAGGADLTVWYRWTAPSDGTVTLSEGGENYVRAYRGDTLGNLTPAGNGALSSTDQFTAVRGEVYSIAVGSVSTSFPAGHWTGFTLRLDQTTIEWVKPAQNATFVQGTPIALGVATTEAAGEISGVSFLDGKTVLATIPTPPFEWTWATAEPGQHTMSARVELRSGELISSANRTVRVRTSNTNLLTAATLTGPAGTVIADLRGADRDTGSTLASAWYRWTAPASGYWLIQTSNRVTSGVGVQFTLGDDPAHLTLLRTNGSLALRGWLATAVTNGVTYNLRIISSPGLLATPLNFAMLAAPANDAFATPQLLAGTSLTNIALTLPASAEPGEPAHGSKAAIRSVWYRWTAPARGLLVVGRSSVSAIYTGDTFATLQRVSTFSGSTSSASVEAGVTYRIVIDELNGTTPDVSWTLGFSASPLNDAFAASIPLEGRRLHFVAQLSLGTSEPDEPPSFGHTVWYRWTAPASGRVALNSSPAAGLAVYRGSSLTDLTVVAQDVWNVGFDAEAGKTYLLRIDTNGGAGPGSTSIDLLLNQPPANDNLAQAETLSGAHVRTTGWNTGAGREPGEWLPAGQYGGRSVWYVWTPPQTGVAKVTVTGDIARTILAATPNIPGRALPYSSATVGDTNATIYFQTRAGRPVHIVVDGLNGVSGDFMLALDLTPDATPVLEILRFDDRVGVLCREVPNWPAVIEVSTNLVTWTPWMFIPENSGTIAVPDSIEAGPRFYRLLLEH